ncbi:hypothetical protein BDV28DRAFT_99285 [Aspergillus coremiiformis]|uniref:Uncharacterized protein n=1 Tax=Aspergillus coremiiformis TaxID=138285 RepID=A0A5N6ZAU7_9EURO|nr:hypothetical protein BDV28DRAFT_99285 [Aspergillus coremiiformis]
MKFSLAAIAGLLSAVSAASLPATFTLVAEGGFNVVTDGKNLYFGVTKIDATHKIANFHTVPETGALKVVTYTAGETGTITTTQDLYILENENGPVTLAPPSGSIPAGASATHFGVTDDGFLDHDGKAYFAIEGYGENPVKTIFWSGGHSSTQRTTNLEVKKCQGC